MSEPSPGGAPAPAVVPVAPAVPLLAPAAGASGDPALVSIPSDALKARLAEERGKGQSDFLASIGFQKAEDLKAFVDSAKALQQANMTESEKTTARLKELEGLAPKLTAAESQLKAYSDREFSSLPEGVRAAVDKQANGDPIKRLERIDFLRESGLLGASAGGSAPVVPQAAPLNAAPNGVTPKPAGGAPTAYEKYHALLQAGRSAAADAFYAIHAREITKTTPQGA